MPTRDKLNLQYGAATSRHPHDRLNLQRTAPLIDTHTLDQTHSTQQSCAHSSIALSHAAPGDPSHARSLPLTHPIHSLVGTTLSYNIYSLSHSTTLAHSLNRHTHASVRSTHVGTRPPHLLSCSLQLLTHKCRSRVACQPPPPLACSVTLSHSVHRSQSATFSLSQISCHNQSRSLLHAVCGNQCRRQALAMASCVAVSIPCTRTRSGTHTQSVTYAQPTTYYHPSKSCAHLDL